MAKAEPSNIAEWIDRAAVQLSASGLHYGHGTDNPRDEAAWLVLHAAGAPLDGSFQDWGRAVGPAESVAIRRLLEARCDTRKPLAYLTGTAFFAGLDFEVNEDVLVPRSPLAELAIDRFRPWVEPDNVQRVLDMCTGSGCIAVAAAVHLPHARVDGADISPRALAVARRNAERHGVAERVHFLESDLFGSLPPRRYDLIVANPPYVPVDSLAALPAEYRREPPVALASGEDGLDAPLQILVDAPGYLREDGILICEVGESEERLASLLPDVAFLWLEFEHGGSGVFVLTRPQLEEAGPAAARVLEKRNHVT